MKQDSSSCIKVWNSKCGGNMYSKFQVKFGAISEINFGQAIYHFEVLEVRSPPLQTMCKSKLKQRSYGYLKTTAQS